MPNLKKRPGLDHEEILIRKAWGEDLEAFNQLVLTYQDVAYHHAYALLGNPALSDDVTQESSIKAFQNIYGFHGSSFRTWLLRIVTNSAYDTLTLSESRRHPTQPLMLEHEDGEEIAYPAWLADPGRGVQETVEQNEEAR